VLKLVNTFQQVDDPVGVTAFIVIPGQNLHQIFADDFGRKGVKNCRVGAADDIGTDQWVFAIAQIWVQMKMRSHTKRIVDDAWIDLGLKFGSELYE
jgi:hypothetical protein